MWQSSYGSPWEFITNHSSSYLWRAKPAAMGFHSTVSQMAVPWQCYRNACGSTMSEAWRCHGGTMALPYRPMAIVTWRFHGRRRKCASLRQTQASLAIQAEMDVRHGENDTNTIQRMMRCDHRHSCSAALLSAVGLPPTGLYQLHSMDNYCILQLNVCVLRVCYTCTWYIPGRTWWIKLTSYR